LESGERPPGRVVLDGPEIARRGAAGQSAVEEHHQRPRTLRADRCQTGLQGRWSVRTDTKRQRRAVRVLLASAYEQAIDRGLRRGRRLVNEVGVVDRREVPIDDERRSLRLKDAMPHREV